MQRSPRADKPFVVVDCGAISPNLVESELFGHVRGAFTGADRDRIGAFEAADGGTVFLDEIGELPLELQPKLLRALEPREIRRVGETTTRKVNVRVISATNRDLEREVNKGTLPRGPLLPPRGHHACACRRSASAPRTSRTSSARSSTLARCDGQRAPLPAGGPRGDARHDWPGNVRELRNYVERSVVLQTARMSFRRRRRGAGFAGPAAWGAAPGGRGGRRHRAVQGREGRAHRLLRARVPSQLLEAAGGNMTKAARMAGIDRMYLHRLVQKHGTRDQMPSSVSDPSSAQQRKPVE